MAPPLSPLPIDNCLADVLAALAGGSSVVVRAPPGAGKTTRVPPAMLDAGLAAAGQILVLQPRRVAARATAARIAAERGSRLGDEIGYQVRFESRIGSRTRLAIITEGILLRRLLDDPFLPDVAAVVFDEFHERSLTSDLSLAMVRQVQQTVRPELKIVIMSATLAAEPVARYLGDCPMVTSAGRAFPVEVRYLPHLDRRPLVDLVAEGVREVLGRSAGDCLVFLPGVGEIRRCAERLNPLADAQRLALLQLYGDLPADRQDAVLVPSPQRKLILATNVAETSLTIEGVTGVVDSGLARSLRYDPGTGLDRLELGPISQAAAEQRAGRAGRTQPGVCLRLWPEASHRSRPAWELPEIARVDLAGAVLQVLCWIEPDVAAFPWYEPPAPAAIERAQTLLQQLDAVRAGRITPLGRRMAALPVHPRIGRLLIEGEQQGCVDQAALAAALLSERSPFLPSDRPGERRTARVKSRSDVLDRVQALEQFEVQGTDAFPLGRLNRSAAKQLLRTRDQLLRTMGRSPAGAQGAGEEAFLRSLLASYPDRLARRREPGSRRGIMIGGRGVRLADEVAVSDEELYVCVDLDSAGGDALVRQASAVERAWLPAEHIVSQTVVEFDEASSKIVARRRVAVGDLVIEESPGGLPRSHVVAEALAAAAASRLDRAFPADDPAVASFRIRAQCLATWLPELDLPRLDDDQLRLLLPQLASGRRSLAEVHSAPWLAAMQGLFTWQQLQTLDREAPERIGVPSGSRLAVAYEVGRPPVLAVRIQEVFGMMETPRVARGRVRVLMHLLAPNMRVAQVTDDLASFWAKTYALVRKDLRARYPKHAWPEDPYRAIAERRPQRKK